jgi:hypothetical protein
METFVAGIMVGAGLVILYIRRRASARTEKDAAALWRKYRHIISDGPWPGS